MVRNIESGKNLFETKAVSYVYSMNRRPYPSDVSDEEWAFVMPYLTLLSGRKPAKIRPAGSVQRPALAGKNGSTCPTTSPHPTSFVGRPGAGWSGGCWKTWCMTCSCGRVEQPNPAPLSMLHEPCSPAPRAGRPRWGRKGSQVHMAVDTLGHLLALRVTPANKQERSQVGELSQAVQASGSKSHT